MLHALCCTLHAACALCCIFCTGASAAVARRMWKLSERVRRQKGRADLGMGCRQALTLTLTHTHVRRDTRTRSLAHSLTRSLTHAHSHSDTRAPGCKHTRARTNARTNERTHTHACAVRLPLRFMAVVAGTLGQIGTGVQVDALYPIRCPKIELDRAERHSEDP